jgi:hypothetical protein
MVTQVHATNVEIHEVVGGKEGARLDYPAKHRWVWANNAPHPRVLKSLVEIEMPFDLTSTTPDTKLRSRVKVVGHRLFLAMKSLNEQVVFSNGHDLTIRVHIRNPDADVEDHCEESGLKIVPDHDAGPFYLGLSCLTTDGSSKVTLTFPQDVELNQSNLFETAGKGEVWRVYDLKKLNTNSKEQGRFEFSLHGKNYAYSLVSQKVEVVKKQSEPIFSASLGAAALKLKGETVSSSDTKPMARLQLLPQMVWSVFGGGANIDSTVGFSNSQKTINFIQVSAYGYLRLRLSSGFEIHPRLYYVVANESSGQDLGFQSNQIGAGVYAIARINPANQIRIEAMTDSLGSKIVKSQLLIDISYMHLMSQNRRGWGFGGFMQNYKVGETTNTVNNLVADAQLNEVGAYFLLAF